MSLPLDGERESDDHTKNGEGAEVDLGKLTLLDGNTLHRLAASQHRASLKYF